MSQLGAHEVALHKVFSSDYDFSIPNYQRPYSWRPENAQQLVEDLDDALTRADDQPYFLGSIVLVKQEDSAASKVIDGQQRLTTLTILLAVLRDLTTDIGLRSEVEQLIAEPGLRMRKLAPKPRLTLRSREAAFFRDYVQTAGALEGLLKSDPHSLPTDSQRAILANVAAIHATLTEWSEEKRFALLSMLSERTYLVVVSTNDEASAHRIFSVMNARGLDLSPADIFKSKVIGDLSAEREEQYSEKWENAEESLGRDDFADLFQHVRVIYAKERAKKILLTEFEEQVLSQYLPGQAAEFVDDIVVPYADAYATVRDRTYIASSGAESVNAWLRRLAQIDNNDWRPPALWALRHHRDDPDLLEHFLRALERLAASMLIRRVYATPRALRYASLLRELSDGYGAQSPALALDEAERSATRDKLNGEIYLTTPVVKYALTRLDEILAGEPGVTYKHKIISIEHVLPQNPKDNSEWTRQFTPEERGYWTHRLANLVLLNRSKNSEARNYDFPIKKRRYFTSRNGVVAFALTSQVVSADRWTPVSLAERQQLLVDVLCKEWSL